MQHLEEQNHIPYENKTLKNHALDFILHGVACNCLVALSQTGILEILLQKGLINEQEILNYPNATAIKSTLLTLEKCNILERHSNSFTISPFGKSISNYIGLITIFFDGYGKLVANQTQILTQGSSKEKLVRWPTVSRSSVEISNKMIDPIIIEEFKKLNFSGTICDLGCGHGNMLTKVCESTGNPGLGFEGSSQTVRQAKKNISKKIKILAADITQLNGLWDDVIVLMQAFVFHDFFPEKKCINILNSYLKNFPNLEYFFYIDIVSPSISCDSLFPGFDYIHGLLGIPTRTYEETLNMFQQSNYYVMKEVPIIDLPNTFLWILSPSRLKNGAKNSE